MEAVAPARSITSSRRMPSTYVENQPLQQELAEYFDTGSSSNLLLKETRFSTQKRATYFTYCRRALPWLLHFLLLSTSIIFFLSARSAPKLSPQTWYAIVGDNSPVNTVRFHGNLEYASPFKGPPSKIVDEAWDAIIPLGVMGISEAIYQTLNSSKHAAKVPAEGGGGYMAVFESIHLIHCVALWETTYPSYYTAEHAFSIEHPVEWHAHMDHCADILRQKLMCDADDRLITYNWIKKHYAPKPNFNVQHQCRDYGRLLDTTKKLQADGSKFANGWILRPLDRHVVEFSEPPFDPNADE